ncbi:iron-sulfur cluster biosynthesis family protein [Methanothrix thermoacetophila]|uniref:HesB/YadR/YfhF-family protein n=1 Tax=Methanothrix thermoacetophila (strain DSM 6194 / JCM 14653 / NBRC 101360 / PT) TaxID=349307 RepID=A0B821_METTP|nr:iron-sulfur cluster biosynthesis family protein [Methanothrix thermoacetophila]ABK14845.1 HesB/YadR/YfhF-family protein [Methanothrix thermoacetophila PT]
MIEITDAAAMVMKEHLVPGKVVRMFLAAIDETGANYGLAVTDPAENDVLFESNGITIHMSPEDAEILSETIIDFIDDPDIGRGFIIYGPGEESCGCGHEHDYGCGCH